MSADGQPYTDYLDAQFEQLLLFPPEALTAVFTIHLSRGDTHAQFGTHIALTGTSETIAIRVSHIPLDEIWATRIGLAVEDALEAMARRIEPFL